MSECEMPVKIEGSTALVTQVSIDPCFISQLYTHLSLTTLYRSICTEVNFVLASYYEDKKHDKIRFMLEIGSLQK